MAHHLDIDSIHKNIFIILNLCYGSKTFAQNHNLDPLDEKEPINHNYYYGWLRGILSEKLIDSAIKTRILFDSLREQDEENRLHNDIKHISEQYNIGYFSENDNKVDVREACNKIIHALEIFPVDEIGDEEHFLDEESQTKREWEYWSGNMRLFGQKGKNEWSLDFHVSQFCEALEDVLTHLENKYDFLRLYE